MDLLCYFIETGHIDDGTLLDLLDLLWSLYHRVIRHYMAFQPDLLNFFIKSLVALLVLLAASAPARVISPDFLDLFLPGTLIDS